MSISEKQSNLIEQFQKKVNWEDRYKLIIEKGKNLEPLDEKFKIESHKVKGCQSQVWLVAELGSDNKMILKADSDALIVKGLVSLLLEVYSGETPENVLEHPPEFIKKLGFDSNLSPSRANGLMSMIRQIMYYATAFKFLNEQKKTKPENKA